MSDKAAATAMPSGEFDFPGATDLIALVAEAVEEDSPDAITEKVKNGLCQVISSEGFRLPAEFLEAEADHYARRLVHSDPEGRFSIVAMTWGVGQGTPLHDHCGLWCVEGVCHGRIRVDQYALVERDGDRFRFERDEAIPAETGTAGCLIPPHEYHRIFNDRDDEVAVTLHIYGGDMESCNIFDPEGDGWYRRERRALGFDA